MGCRFGFDAHKPLTSYLCVCLCVCVCMYVYVCVNKRENNALLANLFDFISGTALFCSGHIYILQKRHRRNY